MHMATLDRGWARVKYGKGAGSDGLGDDAGGGAMDGNGEGGVRESAAECAGTSQGDLRPIAWANAGLALWLRGTCVKRNHSVTPKKPSRKPRKSCRAATIELDLAAFPCRTQSGLWSDLLVGVMCLGSARRIAAPRRERYGYSLYELQKELVVGRAVEVGWGVY